MGHTAETYGHREIKETSASREVKDGRRVTLRRQINWEEQTRAEVGKVIIVGSIQRSDNHVVKTDNQADVDTDGGKR